MYSEVWVGPGAKFSREVVSLKQPHHVKQIDREKEKILDLIDNSQF